MSRSPSAVHESNRIALLLGLTMAIAQLEKLTGKTGSAINLLFC